MVFGAHAWGHSGSPDVHVHLWGLDLPLESVFLFGGQGVTLFFVLSGFLLSQPFWLYVLDRGPSVDTGRYLMRRLLRIYPAYLVAVIFFALFYDVAHPLLARLIMAVTHVLLIHNFFEVTVFNLSAPLWSVATEFQMYLFLPLIFVLLGHPRARRFNGWLAAVGVFVIGGVLGILAFPPLKSAILTVSPDPRIVTVGGNVLPALPLFGLAHFSAGIAAAYVYIRLLQNGTQPQRSRVRQIGDVLSVISVALLASVALFSPTVGLPPSSWPGLSLLFAMLVLGTSLGGASNRVTWLLEFGPIRWLGIVSYSFYLYHDFVLWTVYNRLEVPRLFMDPDLLKAIIAFGLALPIAWVSFVFIEQKLTMQIRRVAEIAFSDSQTATQATQCFRE